MTEEWTYQELLAKYREELKQFQFVTKKEIVMHLAKKLEEEGTPKDQISARLTEDLKGYDVSSDYIRHCLGDEYKQDNKKREESAAKKTANITEKSIELSTSGESIKSETEPESKTFEKMPWQQLSDEERNRLYDATAGYYEENRKELEKEIEKKIEEDALNTKDGIINDQKIEIDKLKEMLTEQKKILDETIKSVNAAAQLKKNIPVLDSLEYKALESQIYVLQQENKDLKQLAQMHMKQNPSETFKPASAINTLASLVEQEVEFPAKELSTLWADARIARQVMYLKIKDGKVVGWESDTKRGSRS